MEINEVFKELGERGKKVCSIAIYNERQFKTQNFKGSEY